MNYKKIGISLLNEKLVDHRMLIAHVNRSYHSPKLIGTIDYKSDFFLPYFMILSINDTVLNISYSKSFGGFKKLYATFNLSNLIFENKFQIDRFVVVYNFSVCHENTKKKLSFIGTKNKDKLNNLVEHIIDFNKKNEKVEQEFELFGIPNFKFFSESGYNDAFKLNLKKEYCPCCGKISEYIYFPHLFYSLDLDLKNLCPYCISDGTAAKKYKCEFIKFSPKNLFSESDKMELIYKTPSFNAYQDPSWRFCCNSPCTFLGVYYFNDLDKISIPEKIRDLILKDSSFIQQNVDSFEFNRFICDEKIQIAFYQCPKCGDYLFETFRVIN